ncbi:MAG TPA: LPS assembly protein LptD, partial [Opitutaceae bacterium]|nr:LPS assembly protein LptD [Opitutaceae bacterium]
MRRIARLIALAAALAPALRAQPKADLSADSTISIDEATGDLMARPNARFVDTGLLLTADEIRFNQRTQVASASGHVVLTRIGDRLLADRLTYNRTNGTFTAQNLRAGRFPYYIEGPTAEGSPTEVVVHDATVTYREPGPWQPVIRARTLAYSPGHYLHLAGANLGIGDYLPLPISRLGEDLAHQTSLWNMTIDGGYRHNLGPYLDAAFHIPFATGASAGPDFGIYAYRGLMVGPVANYNVTTADGTMSGYLKSGYIYDVGKRLTDILNDSVPPNRAYIEWRHNQQITPDLALNGEANWSSDSEVLRDFHAKEFVPVQEPDNFLEMVYTGADYLGSVFTRFQPDAFYPVQERLPEIRFDLLPTAIGGGIYARFESSIAHLDENPPDGGAHLRCERFDTFLGLTRPFSYKGILDVAPVVGGRFTEYWDTAGAAAAGGTSRALGEIGFDADLKMSATFDYVNPLWHIDGLRHLLTPTLSYRYIPNADKSSDWIPPIDRVTFSNYLPVMELGDMRALDQLQAQNALRFGLNNTLQTRDKTYGSTDLLTLNFADDVRFKRAPGQPDFSNIYAELTATPAHWLELRVEDTVSATRASQRAMDTTVTVREGEVWSAGFGVGYLSDKYGTYYVPGLGAYPIVGLDIFHAEVRARLNEQYEAFARGDYDARAHLFVDQFYGFTQKLSNTWVVEYTLGFSSGPNKGRGHFGFNASLNMTK